ncbi:MAG: hypothetical protein LC715_08605, partial [Gammaproteobacteria bacterium]|nr:hypothetical protein [Gammaproteobacteria bacterium]
EGMILGTAGFTAALALLRMLENRQSPDIGPLAVTGATGGVVVDAKGVEAGGKDHAFARHPSESWNLFLLLFQMISGYRSRQSGFLDSASSIFQIRFQALMAFSRDMADSMVPCCSYQTSVWTPCCLVKPATKSFLC